MLHHDLTGNNGSQIPPRLHVYWSVMIYFTKTAFTQNDLRRNDKVGKVGASEWEGKVHS